MNLLVALMLLAPAKATITVHLNEPLGNVSRLMFGHNVEAADGYHIFSNEHSYHDAQTGEGFWNPVTRTPEPKALDYAKSVGMGALRYPGGCLAHGFKWKETVGPVETRPNFAFGVDEYIALCRAIGCEPLMTVSDYSSTPAEAAELVEYLNAPADAGHPWAAKRALWGHPKPYGVRYFEMGNESDHGNHDLEPKRIWTAGQYSEWFNDGAKEMRSVDSTIKIGALMGTGTGPGDAWNGVVLTRTSPDFIIVHTYAVNVSTQGQPATDPADLIMRSCLAAVDQTETLVANYRKVIREKAKRDIPIAITEYNAGFVQELPKPYRLSFGAALFSADYQRALMKPTSGVFMCNYWQILNGYWGMVQGSKEYAALPLYQLLARHTGTKMVRSDVEGPRVEFEGFPGHTLPSHGDKYFSAGDIPSPNLLSKASLADQSGDGFRTRVGENGAVTATLNGVTGEQYPLLATASGPKGSGYVVSFEARSSGMVGTALGISVIDGRGWEPYHSGTAIEGLDKATDWTRFSVRYASLPDSSGILLGWRFRPGPRTATGTVEVRNVQVRLFQPERHPAYPALASQATLSKDGHTLHLIITNRDPVRGVSTTMSVPGAKGLATVETVTATSLDSLSAITRRTSATVVKGSITLTIPPFSMTGIDVSLGRRRSPGHYARFLRSQRHA